MANMREGAISKAPQKAKKSKAKGRKIGRNKDRANLYLISHRFEINKCRRLGNVLRRNPNDVDARKALLEHSKVLSNRQIEDLGVGGFIP